MLSPLVSLSMKKRERRRSTDRIWYIWGHRAVSREPMWLLTPTAPGTASRLALSRRISSAGVIPARRAPGPGSISGYSRGSMGMWTRISMPISRAVPKISSAKGLPGRMDRVSSGPRPMSRLAMTRW